MTSAGAAGAAALLECERAPAAAARSTVFRFFLACSVYLYRRFILIACKHMCMCMCMCMCVCMCICKHMCGCALFVHVCLHRQRDELRAAGGEGA